MDAKRLLPAVGDAHVGELAARGMVGVFDDVARLLGAAGAQVDRVHRRSAGLFAPVAELVQADLVRLGGKPCQIQPLWAVRPDGILPVEAGDEVAAGIADDGDIQPADEVEHVAAKALLVGGRMAGLIDAFVDCAAHVFEE